MFSNGRSNVKNPDLPILSVSDYLDVLNEGLVAFTGRVSGEICNLKLYEGRSYLYFSIKDKKDDSLINCFMWKRDYNLSGVNLEEGLEVIVTGYPKIYKPNGGVSFQSEYLEFVGDGALKKAYEELKLKLESAGFFDVSRKKPIREYPHKIGIITSKDGAVINDFLSNIGNFGYDLQFINSRVEGKLALKELISAVKTFAKRDLDVLVMMRGGGSLESFQAYNSEALVMEIANFPVPVITGLGHDKDLPLCGMVSDLNVSTPTKVAETLNKSWEHAEGKVNSLQKEVLIRYEAALGDSKFNIEKSYSHIKENFKDIFTRFEKFATALETNAVHSIGHKLRELHRTVETMWTSSIKSEYYKSLKVFGTSISSNLYYIGNRYSLSIDSYNKNLQNLEKQVKLNDPIRQLKLGYSLIMKNGKLIKSAKFLESGDIIKVKLFDGEVSSKITEKH